MAKNTPAVKSENTALASFDPNTITIIKRVVVPTLSIKDMKEGDSMFFIAEGELKGEEQIDEKTGEKKVDKNGVAELLHTLEVTMLDTGEYGKIVIPAVAYRGFSAEGELRGRKFGMRKGRSLGTGKANLWEVVEIG